MSKLAKVIDAKLSYRNTPSMNLKYMDIRTGVSEVPPMLGLGTELRVSAMIMKYAVVPPGVDPEDAVKDIKRAIIEEVFGEFRPLIYDMRTALYDGNKAELRKMLGELEDAMFHDGV